MDQNPPRTFPWVNGLRYTFPLRLIHSIHKNANGLFGPDSIAEDEALGWFHKAHSSTVGWWRDRTIDYRFLAPLPSLSELLPRKPRDRATNSFWKSLEWYDPAAVKLAEVTAEWSRKVSAGYCGWLLSNPRFHQHQKFFFARHQEAIRSICGLPPLDSRQDISSAGLMPCIHDYFRLCRRWQLAGMAGPYLPIPLQPQIPVFHTLDHLLPVMARSGGMLFYFPLTHPIPDRSELRNLFEGALTHRKPPLHLKGWFDIISAKNSGKKSIDGFERRFRLQHWWRLVHFRCGTRMKKDRSGHLQQAFAEFFFGDDENFKGSETVRSDLTLLNKSLGREWARDSALLSMFA